MINCRYVGGDSSTIGEREFDAVGQRASFGEELFRDVILGGAAFLPDVDFDRVGFTAKELDEHGPVGSRDNLTPGEFCSKLELAHAMYHDLKDRLTREPLEVAVAG